MKQFLVIPITPQIRKDFPQIDRRALDFLVEVHPDSYTMSEEKVSEMGGLFVGKQEYVSPIKVYKFPYITTTPYEFEINGVLYKVVDNLDDTGS